MDLPRLSREEFERIYNPNHPTLPQHPQLKRLNYEDYINDMTFFSSLKGHTHHAENARPRPYVSAASTHASEKADEDVTTPQKAKKRRRNHRSGKRRNANKSSTDAATTAEEEEDSSSLHTHLQNLRVASSPNDDRQAHHSLGTAADAPQNQNPNQAQAHIQNLHKALEIHALLLPRLNALPTGPDEVAEMATLHDCLGKCERHLHILLRAEGGEEEERWREMCVGVLELVAAGVMRREGVVRVESDEAQIKIDEDGTNTKKKKKHRRKKRSRKAAMPEDSDESESDGAGVAIDGREGLSPEDRL